MINLIAPITDAPYVQSMKASRKSDFESLFHARNRLTAIDSPSRYKVPHRCMATLTEDACCAFCGLEFEP